MTIESGLSGSLSSEDRRESVAFGDVAVGIVGVLTSSRIQLMSQMKPFWPVGPSASKVAVSQPMVVVSSDASIIPTGPSHPDDLQLVGPRATVPGPQR